MTAVVRLLLVLLYGNVSCMQVGDHPDVEKTFGYISEQTGGEFNDLNLDVETEVLVDVLCTFSITAAGDHEQLAEYRRRYKRLT